MAYKLRSYVFQLHHTGIKTNNYKGANGKSYKYFNCTIQELKPDSTTDSTTDSTNFNCTIQELKHHVADSTCKRALISIAPYRN